MTDPVRGAGAWTTPPYYSRKTVAGATGRVAYGTIAVKRALFANGAYTPSVRSVDRDRFDAGWSTRTDDAVEMFQGSEGLVVDGIVGRKTADRLFRLWIGDVEHHFNIPDHLLYGLARQESALDPGAQGVSTPADRGLLQYSSRWHPEISDREAYALADWCLLRAGASMAGRANGMGPSRLAWDCAVAAHNNPSKAVQWWKNGVPPDEQIAGYVASVRKLAAQW